MSSLYIIGNGFDREHGLKTSYWDFRNYLEKYEREFLTELEHMYDIPPFEKIDRRYKKNRELWEKQKEVINYLWQDFESKLGEADETEMLDFSKSIVDDLYLEGGPIGIKDTMDAYWEEQYNFIVRLNECLAKWIKQVRISKAVPKKREFFENNRDLFFTFNYTNLLERVYHIPCKHIAHIHGGLPPYCSISPVIGHGNQKKIEKYHELAQQAANEYEEDDESIYNAIENYYKRTWKDTGKYLTMFVFVDFISALSDVNNIEVIGHSYGAVDMPYFDFLKALTSVNQASWKMYCFSKSDYPAAQKAAVSLGLNEGLCQILPAEQFWS